jgi:hypothetical protein
MSLNGRGPYVEGQADHGNGPAERRIGEMLREGADDRASVGGD